MNERTHYIIGDRMVGKTTKLLFESANKRIPIICARRDDVRMLSEKAKSLSIDIPAPICVTSENLNKLRNYPNLENGCLVDDIDFFLQKLLGIKIVSATANLVSFSNIELVTVEGNMCENNGSRYPKIDK